IYDDGRKSCDSGDFVWQDAPEHYCLHVYPRQTPKDNRYIELYQDSCSYVDGTIGSWDIFKHKYANCTDDPIIGIGVLPGPSPTGSKSRKRRNILSRKHRKIL
ncbi:11586_t:CDS:1, partial [Racocetra fulgida]